MLQFGLGSLTGVPNGGNQGTPSGPQQFGILQDCSLDIDQQLVELRGQYKFPADVAPGNMTIKGKAAMGKIEIKVFNALFFGETTVAGISIIISGEARSIPGSSTYTIQVTNHATFQTDLGVLLASTGAPFAMVASVVSSGQYSVDASTGTYTFYSADASAAVLISYTYTDNTNGSYLPVTNRGMGYGPVFELWLSMPYQGTNGLRLYSCRSSKMSLPLKRDNYTIPDFEFEAYANAAGNVAQMFQLSA